LRMVTARFDFQADYRVFCAYCNAESEQGWAVAAGNEFPHPSLPEGWRVVDGQPVCTKHEVKVTKTKKRGRA